MTTESYIVQTFGYADGEVCRRNGCNGVIDFHPVENCSCHIAPPCGECTAPRGFCPECGWEESEDRIWHINDCINQVDSKTQVVGRWKERELDPTKIDYFIKSHTHFSQICEGVYPDGTTQQQVLEKVKGTFGGRFEYFHNGRFKYIAYTD